MKQSLFSNPGIYWAIVVIIGGLLTWNLFGVITMGRLVGLIPITIQGVLLFLVLTKNQYSKIAIKIWAIIFLIIASGLQFVGKLLQDVADNFANLSSQYYITTGVVVLVGVIIVVLVNKTVEVVEIEN